jgi:hypothetical protein
LQKQWSTRRFHLSKWYLDCVSDDGQVFIGYVARLRWRRIVLHYTSTLRYPIGGESQVITSVRESTSPQVSHSTLVWASRSLGFNGVWTALARPLSRTLFAADSGSIDWHCVQPQSRATLDFGSAGKIEGLGYVEHIAMTVPPWRLPIDELRWGRFLSDRAALVWIDWRGTRPLNLVFYNGRQVESASISEREVIIDSQQVRLGFEQREVLREGPLIKTALAMIPGVQRLFPSRSLQTYECKWRSRTVLRQREKLIGAGWTIHEIVRFGPGLTQVEDKG